MRQIEKILSEIGACINQGVFKKVEDDKLDLKDNSHNASEWKEVYKTSCSFLNTGGGIILIGIYENEKNKTFTITGYDKSNEEKTKTIPKIFTNEEKQPLDLSQYFPHSKFMKF